MLDTRPPKKKEKKLKPFTAELTEKTKAMLKKLKSRISSYVKQLSEKYNISVEKIKLKEYSGLALKMLFGFLMSVARLPQDIRPFGIAAINAFSGGENVLIVYAGAAAGCFFYGNEALSSFIIYFMLYVIRKSFTESKFNEKLHTKLLESASASMAVGIVRICALNEHPLYSYIAFLSLCAISVCFTYFFSVLFNNKDYSVAKLSTVSICSYALMGALICAFDGVYVFGFDLRIVLACLITVSYAALNGFLHAGIVGFVCGIACQNPVVSACMGICGIVTALLVSKSVPAAIFSFAPVFFTVAAYSSGLDMALYLLPSVLCGCVLFFPIAGFLPDTLRLNVKALKSNARSTASGAEASHRKKLSEAFFAISDMFLKLSDKQKYPSAGDVETALNKSFSTVCAGCALSEMCYAKKKTDMEDLKETMYAVLSSRPAEPDDFGAGMNDKCIRLDSQCEALNRAYREIAVMRASDNRTALLGAQYAGMARLITDTGKKSISETERDTIYEKSLEAAFDGADIPYSYIIAQSSREKKVKVFGINIDRIPFGAGELRKYIFARCGVRITNPSFDISEKNEAVMSFERAPAISVEYSQKCKPKADESVNGDTVNFLHSTNGYFRAYICDGMGSGREAAASSRLASLFLEKMLSSDTGKNIILELLNNALMSRSTESFSTVDLFEADLLTGRCSFIKAGAAPTYILRSGKLYKIFSATPPVGIITGFTAESTRFDVEPGDVIIMMSDGVVQTSDDSQWLAELIRVDLTKDPSVLAASILEKSMEINDRQDDMSVCVIKIKSEK